MMRSRRWTLGSFLAFWRPSLSRRLTISFTLFGLLIGYAVFIFLSASTISAFINLASNVVEQRIAPLSLGKTGDSAYELFKLLEFVRRDLVNSEKAFEDALAGITFNLYLRENGKWLHMYLDAEGKVQSQATFEPALTNALERAKGRKILTSSRLFFGTQDKVDVKINLTREETDRIYILSFDIYQKGILNFLNDNLHKSLLFFFGLLLMSRTLGFIFSIRLSRPIEQLAQEATVIASGQYENRFSTGRRDEIGVLAKALNNMATRIIDGTRERESLLIGILIALTRAIDAKSSWTAGHSERVALLAEAIGRELQLDDEQMHSLKIAAILHDIGKIAVPEQILDKPGKLTDEEFAIVKKHPETGADIISSIPSYETILPGILHHHERWDGMGYPTGVAGENIPLAARIICIADVYDALTADRPYRRAWSQERAMRFFDEQQGNMFDPELVELFRKKRPAVPSPLACRGAMNMMVDGSDAAYQPVQPAAHADGS